MACPRLETVVEPDDEEDEPPDCGRLEGPAHELSLVLGWRDEGAPAVAEDEEEEGVEDPLPVEADEAAAVEFQRLLVKVATL